MSRSSRAESLRILHSGELSTPPHPDTYRHLEPDSPAAKAFFHSLKPGRFAALAQAMDVVLERKQSISKLAGGALLAGASDPWPMLKFRSFSAMQIAINQARKTPAYQNAAAYNDVAEAIFPQRAIDLEVQLLSGDNTSSSSMITLLRNAPHIVGSLRDADRTDGELGEIMRQSVGLPWRIAMVSIRQLMDIQEGLGSRTTPKVWETLQTEFDPGDFRLQSHEDGGSTLHYQDFDQIPTHAGYPDLSGPEDPESPSYNGPTIGCPITLLRKRLHQEWEQYIDVAVTNHLWEADPSPEKA